MNRRKAISLSIAGLAVVGAGSLGYELLRKKQSVDQMHKDPLYPYVFALMPWSEDKDDKLESFLAHCSQKRLSLIAQSLELRSDDNSINAIEKRMIWLSTNILSYRLEFDVNYHEIVQWTAGKYGVDSSEIQSASTFKIEHRIMQKLFVQIWDKLSLEQRGQILDKLNSTSPLKVPLSVGVLGGSAALAVLAPSVKMPWSFYQTMSEEICSALAAYGVSMPVTGGYAVVSETVASFAGPIGMAIAALAATGALAIAGSANSAKCAAFIAQMHFIKADALNNSDMLMPTLQNLHLA